MKSSRNKQNGTENKRDGILGGYSLHILQPPLGGGVFWVSSDLNSGKKVRVFHFRGGGAGVLCKLRSAQDRKLEFFIGGGGCSV